MFEVISDSIHIMRIMMSRINIRMIFLSLPIRITLPSYPYRITLPSIFSLTLISRPNEGFPVSVIN